MDKRGAAILIDDKTFRESFKRMLLNENMLKNYKDADDNFKENYLKMMEILEKNYNRLQIKKFMEEL